MTAATAPRRRVLFVIRTKLGDSLVCYASVRAYADTHPEEDISLLIRADYGALLAEEPGIRVIPFGSRLGMMARLLWLRLTEPPFDVLATLWGFGRPVRRIAQLVKAKRKIYLDGRYPDLYPEWPAPGEVEILTEPAWRVARLVDPALPLTQHLRVGSLARLREMTLRPGAVGLVPLADELRRNLDAPALAQLVEGARQHYPGKRLWVLLNLRDPGARELREQLPEGVEAQIFSSLPQLVSLLAQLDAYVGTDTGLYHLSAAMGIPATVFFGPGQPRKVILPEQAGITWIRLSTLGNRHCEVKDCPRPYCLHQAVASWSRAPCQTGLHEAPPSCPLQDCASMSDHFAINAISQGGQDVAPEDVEQEDAANA